MAPRGAIRVSSARRFRRQSQEKRAREEQALAFLVAADKIKAMRRLAALALVLAACGGGMVYAPVGGKAGMSVQSDQATIVMREGGQTLVVEVYNDASLP